MASCCRIVPSVCACLRWYVLRWSWRVPDVGIFELIMTMTVKVIIRSFDQVPVRSLVLAVLRMTCVLE